MFDRFEKAGLDQWTARVLLLALALAFIHHVDHVLRVDHSGWPFREQVTPFTYSLAAYPVIIFALIGSVRLYWLRCALLVGATLFTLYAHTLVENPATQFHMWAHNESAHDAGIENALSMRSPAMGWLAATVSMLLNTVAVVGSLLMLRQGLRLRNFRRTRSLRAPSPDTRSTTRSE